ncbi:DUF6338 family protein [Streptomyces sp. NPDC006458]|uniref:DUF6338 family protein n=1 Tax=Streptomyces sp. NPDC006458 TaxID=3154302 RepID=UPI0033B3F685
MGIPTTLAQLVLVTLTVLPGVTYQFVGERLRGRQPGERELGERVLRALAASVVLDLVYLTVAGPWFARTLGNSSTVEEAVRRHGHLLGAAALICVFAVPAGAAYVCARWQGQRNPTLFARGAPTAWDAAFSVRGKCFVRARLKDSRIWVGGFYGTKSYCTSYPESQELYLQSSWSMTPDGQFLARVPHTGGIVIRASDIDILEFVHPK